MLKKLYKYLTTVTQAYTRSISKNYPNYLSNPSFQVVETVEFAQLAAKLFLQLSPGNFPKYKFSRAKTVVSCKSRCKIYTKSPSNSRTRLALLQKVSLKKSQKRAVAVVIEKVG